MTDKNETDKGPELSEQPGVSTSNPVASSRRRLLRAVGASGGATVGMVLASRWQRPVVESVLLPAHAQTTSKPDDNDNGNDPDPGGCTISVAATVDHGDVFTVELVVAPNGGGGSTTVASLITEDDNVTLAGSTTVPPGTYDVFGTISHPSSSFVTFTFAASCCLATTEATGNDETGQSLGTFFATVGSGDCSFVI